MKFSILKAGTASKRGREELGDYDGMFLDLLSQPEDHWEVYDVENGKFPEDIGRYDGIVITGSKHSVYEEFGWIRKLLKILREAFSKEVPILGVCFGHQAVAKALGGDVIKNPEGWELGLKSIYLTESGKNLDILTKAPNPFRVLEVHQDIVSKLPPGAENLAYSETTKNEMFILGSRVLTIQGHPEMDNQEVKEIITKRITISPAMASAGLDTLKEEPHRDFLRSLMVAFLKGDAPGA